MSKKYKILVVSSISPDKSANLGRDIIVALEKRKYEVDFLTKYKTPDGKVSSVFDIPEPIQIQHETVLSRLKKKLPFLKFLKRPNFLKKQINLNGYTIVNEDETLPPVNIDLVMAKIEKSYDFVIVLFWQYMLTAQTLKFIYEKLQVPVFILAVDMYPLTGGCYYFKNCNRFLLSCGKCPGLNSKNPNDFTHTNFLIKKDIYESMNCAFLGNSWMNQFVLQSPLFKNKPVFNVILPINEFVFKPLFEHDVLIAKKSMEIPFSKKFIMFAGAAHTSLERKGFTYLIESINTFIDKIELEKKSEILLLLAGNTIPDIVKLIKVDVLELGYLNLETLAKAYNVCNLFLSPSIEDAGPTMVNQAIMSGTPVVSFDIGVAKDIVISGETGYRAKLKDVEDFAKGIKSIYRLSEKEKEQMSNRCRTIGLEKFSLDVFASKVEDIINSLIF